jgi:hypothetical protein
MQIAMHALAGLETQEFSNAQISEVTIHDHSYHSQIYLYDPHFSQLFLAVVLH